MTSPALFGTVSILLWALGISGIVGSLLVAVNYRGLASAVMLKSAEKGSRRVGFLFRGEYSLGLARIFSLGLTVLGIDLMTLGGVPLVGRFQFLIIVFGWLYIGFAAWVRLHTGFRRMIPPITVPMAVAIFGIHFALIIWVASALGR